MEIQQQQRQHHHSKKPNSRFRRICVFCGSSSGKKSAYQLAAIQLGKELVERNIDLVYGGGSSGLMGFVSHAVYDGGRHVLGVIPKTLMPAEIIGETVGEVKAVTGMHQRKAEMAKQADAFIALPDNLQDVKKKTEVTLFSTHVGVTVCGKFGRVDLDFSILHGGYGTLEELLEVITWAQLGIHDKPVGLLNVDGYYNSLLCFVDKAVDEGFITPSARHIIVSSPTAHGLISKLEEYVPVDEGGAPKLSWEMDSFSQHPSLDISR